MTERQDQELPRQTRATDGTHATDATDATNRLLESAQALGIEIDREEAARWIEAVSAESAGKLTVDVDTGVYGHRITMEDHDAADLARQAAAERGVGRMVLPGSSKLPNCVCVVPVPAPAEAA